MALFGLRGGQPFYPMYQATQMPELSAPAGLSSYIQLNAKSSSGKSEKENKDDDGSSIFPGTYGVRQQVQQQLQQMQAIYNNTMSVLQNSYGQWLKDGKDPKEFFNRPDVQEQSNKIQTLVYQEQQLSDLRPSTNEDLRRIETAEKNTTTYGDIATHDVGGLNMPMLWKNGIPANYTEYYNNERNRQDKIRYDKYGNVSYQQSEIPTTINTSGAFTKYMDDLYDKVKGQTTGSEGFSTAGFDPTGLNAVIHIIETGKSDNFGQLNSAAIALENQMSNEAKVDADKMFWADVRANRAMVLDQEKHQYRPMNEQEFTQINDLMSGNLSQEEANEVFENVRQMMMYNRVYKIRERASAYRKSDQSVSVGAKVFDQGEYMERNKTGFYYNLMQGKEAVDKFNDPQFGFVIRSKTGERRVITGNNVTYTRINDQDVIAENEKLRNAYLAVRPDEIGGTTIKLNKGTIIPIVNARYLKLIRTTGKFHTSYDNERYQTRFGFVYDPNNKESVNLMTEISAYIDLANKAARKKNMRAAQRFNSIINEKSKLLRLTTPMQMYQQYEMTGSWEDMHNVFDGVMAIDQNGKEVNLKDVIPSKKQIANFKDLSPEKKAYMEFFGFRIDYVPGAPEDERVPQVIFTGNIDIHENKIQECEMGRTRPQETKNIQVFNSQFGQGGGLKNAAESAYIE